MPLSGAARPAIGRGGTEDPDRIGDAPDASSRVAAPLRGRARPTAGLHRPGGPDGPAAAAPIRWAILVAPGFPMMAFANLVEPLRAANELAGRPLYSWRLVSPDGAEVRASCGIALRPDQGADSAPPAERIVVCTGGAADARPPGPEIAWIRRSLRAGARVGAVADGAFLLARAGLLNGHACTLHDRSRSAFAAAFPDLELRREIFVIDRTRFTSAGGAAAFDMMLALIAEDGGPALAGAVADWFVHAQRNPGARPPEPSSRAALVADAIAEIESGGGETRLDVAGLAGALGVSSDRLERAFRAETGLTPGAWDRRARLRRAADLLERSTLPVREVAMACGYTSLSAFSRAFRAEHGRAPRESRRR
ncbi:transcriptional regulator, AraC family with amidase-like domain [Albimonas donghaensis]|uniref:Transcriptional regulator, AraC family with amidase-like domain n=1 Tax=Albimonas donghaensis TaxID=356660 RepID=A0A1H2QVA6_9RHOB|nr:GlxA family transcriptional regulator [Albimonas donghaensis]SDW11112.1 transcriptional regulator, AraC family with amidase-like domain [Albimonas donghaensis]